MLFAGGPQPSSTDDIDLSEGEALRDLFFGLGRDKARLGAGSQHEGETAAPHWCERRVVGLKFLAERRGEWIITVDFMLDDVFRNAELLSEGAESLVPLFTFSKDLMPRAHVRVHDETGRAVPMPGTRRSRQIACMILMTLANDADMWQCVIPHVADLTDADTRLAGPAFVKLEDQLLARTRPQDWQPAATTPGNCPLVALASAARLFYRSVILLAAFDRPATGQRHKIVTFAYDAPIRITKFFPEFIGYSPLRVAPLILFGGDAYTYHVQLEPPEGVVVVDSRLLYSYSGYAARTGRRALADEDTADHELYDCRGRVPFVRWLRRMGLNGYGSASLLRVRPIPRHSVAAGLRRWSGVVEGSAEPLSAHVRIAARRFPPLIDGRDAVAIFHLYPDIEAFAGLFVGAAINFLFLLAVFLSVCEGLPIIPATWLQTPEPLFIVAVLIAGFGSGLALYRREHIITAQVSRPWRGIFALQVLAVIVSLVALTDSFDQNGVTSDTRAGVIASFVVAAAAMAYLILISVRAWVAQRAGGRLLYGWQGAIPRRRRYKWSWYVDQKGVPGQPEPRLKRRPHRTDITLESLAEHYFNEDIRRRLFNQGVPAASRHDPSSRGSSRS